MDEAQLLWIRLSFADLVSGAQTVLRRALNRSRTVPDVYIRQVRSSRVTRQDPSHLANTLANTDGLLVSDLHHLANNLTNSDDKADDFTREDGNLISGRSADRYHSRNVLPTRT